MSSDMCLHTFLLDFSSSMSRLIFFFLCFSMQEEKHSLDSGVLDEEENKVVVEKMINEIMVCCAISLVSLMRPQD